VTPPSTPAPEAGAGVATLGYGWRRLHDERVVTLSTRGVTSRLSDPNPREARKAGLLALPDARHEPFPLSGEAFVLVSERLRELSLLGVDTDGEADGRGTTAATRLSTSPVANAIPTITSARPLWDGWRT
jgi:hypothetical protein